MHRLKITSSSPFLFLPPSPHPSLLLPSQMKQYANTARCVSQRSTRRRWLISLLWRRSFLDCGTSASAARAACMRTSSVQGVGKYM